MTKSQPDAINYAFPSDRLGKKEFKKMIREAEKGPFYTIPQLKEEMAKLRARHSK